MKPVTRTQRKTNATERKLTALETNLKQQGEFNIAVFKVLKACQATLQLYSARFVLRGYPNVEVGE
jgi:hypothetical protein